MEAVWECDAETIMDERRDVERSVRTGSGDRTGHRTPDPQRTFREHRAAGTPVSYPYSTGSARTDAVTIPTV